MSPEKPTHALTFTTTGYGKEISLTWKGFQDPTLSEASATLAQLQALWAATSNSLYPIKLRISRSETL